PERGFDAIKAVKQSAKNQNKERYTPCKQKILGGCPHFLLFLRVLSSTYGRGQLKPVDASCVVEVDCVIGLDHEVNRALADATGHDVAATVGRALTDHHLDVRQVGTDARGRVLQLELHILRRRPGHVVRRKPNQSVTSGT
uniref:Uncharacterized protein n=1 Tax=Anopheles atroparvus TaxID=41427 RepID=A0AAG5DWA9_ANOAO